MKQILVNADQGKGDEKEHAKQRGIREEIGDVAPQKGAVPKELQIDQRCLGTSLGADEQRQENDRQQDTPDQSGRSRPPRVALVQHCHQSRKRRRDQERAVPVEAALGRQMPGLWDDEPAQNRAGEAERNVDPERPVPAQRIEDQAAQRRTDTQTDRLGRRLQAKRAPAPLRLDGEDDDGDAVRGQQRGPDRLQDAEGNQHGKIRGEATERRTEDEQ